MRKAIIHLKKSDPVLRAIIERVGPFRMEYGTAEFHSLAEAIVYQQLNGKAAVTIFKRLAALAGEPLSPEGILKLSDEQLRSVGLSKQKSAYLKDLAAKTAAGLLDFSRLPEMSDDQVIGHLTQAPGRAAHRRLRRAGRDEKVLSEAQVAQTKRYGKNCPGMVALSQRRLLVFVAEFGYQDDVIPADTRLWEEVDLCG